MPISPRALIVEDDPDSLSALSALVASDGFLVDTATTLASARQMLSRALPDVILVDLNLPDGSGFELLQALPMPPHDAPPVIVLTGHATVESAIEGLRHGIWDYLVKPVNVPRLRSLLARVPRLDNLLAEISGLRAELRRLGHFGAMIGRSPAIQTVYDALDRQARTEASVMLWGEAGTGRATAARTLHDLSRRGSGPFIRFDCTTAARSPRNIETRGEALISLLFGRERGNYGEAERRRPGAFEQANGGTLYLDEITELPLHTQEMLLETLDSRQFMRTGSSQPIASDVRLLVASRLSPRAAAANGLLHEAWLRRLEADAIFMPPLREREDDAVLIAEALVDGFNEAGHVLGNSDKRIAPSFARECMSHGWPGNVAELRERVTNAYDTAGPTLEALNFDGSTTTQTGSIAVRIGMPIAEVEDVLIRATLDAVGGTRHRAAALLGISPKTLYNKLQRMKEEGDEAA